MIMPNYLVFDIETGPLPADVIAAETEPFNPDDVKMGNVKDPELRQNRIEQARQKYYDDIIRKAALDPLTGRVLCVGFLQSNGASEPDLLWGDEEEILFHAWQNFAEDIFCRYVGFNITGFDLPFLIRRSWHLGVAVPAWVFDGRYFHRRFVDVMQCWQMGDRQAHVSLDRLARFVGLEGKKHDGKDFAKLYTENPKEALAYVEHDLRLTEQVARRLMI